MIKVTGSINVSANFAVKLNMSQEDFDKLDHRKQDELIMEKN